MKRSKISALAIIAISVWPALNFLATNWQAALHQPASSLMGVCLVTMALIAVGYLLLRLARRRDLERYAVVAWVELVLLFFGYALILGAISALAERVSLPLRPSLVFLFVAALVLGATFVFRRAQGLYFAAVAFCFVAAALATGKLAIAATNAEYHADRSATMPVAIGATAPGPARMNVYYVILDAYAGPRALREFFGFDDSAFLARMERRGFRDVSTERANYLQTAQTLGSIFALDYALTEGPRTGLELQRIYPDSFSAPVPPPLVARLDAAGYQRWRSPSLWTSCVGHGFRCLGEPSAWTPNYLTQIFLQPTPLGMWTLRFIGRRLDALQSLSQSLPSFAPGAPVFVFAHHNAPHPPYLLDGGCARYADPDPRWGTWDSWSADARPAYVAAVECVNAQVERTVDQILARDPGALIVLQGDHGPAFGMDWAAPMASWSEAAIRERASFLNLVRAPPECAAWLDRPIAQINTARFVVGCVERHAPEYLPERTYLSTYPDRAEHGVIRRWHHGAG